MIFNINEDVILGSVEAALDEASIDLSEEQFLNVADAINDSLPGVINVLVAGSAEKWRNNAIQDGGGWGSKYARAIATKFGDSDGEVYLDESKIDMESQKPLIMFAKMVEEGMKSFSIKEGLLKSEKAKEGKDGIKYIIVPFPIAVPRKSTQGKITNKFGKREMTSEMHKIVKSGERLKSGTVKAGEREIDVAGLTRYITRQYHSGYGIFRCVSEKSEGWVHPGVGPQPIFPSVMNEINRLASEVISAFCKEIVMEYSK